MVACAALRHHGIPARARVGFAAYFVPGFYDDHWVCESYTGDRWRLLDPQLGERVRADYKMTFSPAHVPRDAFLVAGETWRRVRSGAIDPATCGVHAYDLIRAWFIGGNVLKDLAALNKRDPDWKALRDLYDRDETLRVPSVVRSFGPGGPKEVPISV